MRKTQNLRATDRPGFGKSGIRILNLFASDFGIRAFALLTALPLSVTGLPAAVTVNTVDALKAAIEEANANPNADATILIEDGTYHLKWSHLWIGRDGVTLTGKSSNREAVILSGENGMRGGKIEFIFQVSADDVTISDLTLEDVGSHAVIVHGEAPLGADRTVLRNLVIRDTFQQMVKVTPANSDPQKFFSEGGVLEDCLLEYTAGIGPQVDIGGIDAHGAKDWIVRRNVFKNIISPSQSSAEHAVHFWSWSRGTLVENNLIINCDRGIGLAKQGPSLRVADDRVAAPEFRHHRRRHLAGKCTDSMLAHALRTPGDRRTRQRSLRLPQIRIGNAHRELPPWRGRPSGAQVPEQRIVLPQAAVHFPVADDELAAHGAPEENRGPLDTAGTRVKH